MAPPLQAALPCLPAAVAHVVAAAPLGLPDHGAGAGCPQRQRALGAGLLLRTLRRRRSRNAPLGAAKFFRDYNSGPRRNCAQPAMRSGMKSCAQGRDGCDDPARSRARLRRILRRRSVHREEDADQDRGPLRPWFPSATTDAAVITKTWTIYKAADIGLALPRGVLVVDVDVAKGKKGRDDFVRLFGCAPEDMATAVATTARGGWHVIFATIRPFSCPDHDHAESRHQDWRLGLCDRAFRGNGRRWIRSLLSTPLLEAPRWLLERLRKAA